MKFKVTILSILILTTLAGCATVKIPVATGGSRADGVIELTYEYSLFEKPVVMWEEAEKTACTKCQAWGYSGAEAFGGSKVECLKYNEYGDCLRQRVILPYQCVGSLKR